MIPFIDLTRDNEERTEISGKLADILSKGKYILGEEVKHFENVFSKFTGIEHCVGVNSGTDALTLILRVMEAKRTGICAAAPLPCGQAILNAGSQPIFIDSAQGNSGLVDIEGLKKHIKDIDTFIAVHIYGVPENMHEISKICRDNNVKLIEDCSQSIGTYIGDMHTGHFSAAAAFSFYPTKNLGALGDAGLIATDDTDLSALFSMMRNYGQKDIYAGISRGINSRLDEIQAAILSVKFQHLQSKTERRRVIARYYRKHIDNPFLELPDERYFLMGNMHIFPICTDRREQLREYLDKSGIGNAVHYPIPLNRQEVFREAAVTCQHAELLAERELSIPIFPELHEREIKQVINTLNAFNN